MPLTSVYDIGTVTVNPGETEIIGAGTLWTGAAIEDGDTFWLDGLSVRISSSEGNDILHLAHPWPGQARQNVPYEINYAPHISRATGQTRSLISSLDRSSINPLKSLEPQADMLAYYTGAATAALTSLTSKARQLLAFTTNTQILNNLGLVFQANRYDATANRLLRVGAFGLGSTSGQDIPDINNVATPSSFFTVNPLTALGTLPPIVGAKDGVLHMKLTATIAVQTYYSSHSSSPVYYRRSTSSAAWQDWRLIQME